MSTYSVHCNHRSEINTNIVVSGDSRWLDITVDNQEITLYLNNKYQLERLITSLENTIAIHRADIAA
jgi:hypothetical protein